MYFSHIDRIEVKADFYVKFSEEFGVGIVDTSKKNVNVMEEMEYALRSKGLNCDYSEVLQGFRVTGEGFDLLQVAEAIAADMEYHGFSVHRLVPDGSENKSPRKLVDSFTKLKP